MNELDGLTQATISIFDLNEIEASIGAERKTKIKLFGNALRDHGFISIKIEGLADIIHQSYKVTQEYFERPLEVKKLDKFTFDKPFTGYQGRFDENISQIDENISPRGEKGDRVIELKESFLFNGAFRNSSNSDSDFNSSIEKFHDNMSAVANRILTILQDYFGVEDSERCQFNSHSKDSVTRLTWYPPMEEARGNPNVIWCGGHYDISPFALLPKATASGLQMKKDNEEQWTDVNVPEDTIILNTGRIFEPLTAGIIKPTFHRVIADETSAVTGRISMIYFPALSPDYQIKPWSTCLRKATKHLETEEKNSYCGKFLSGTTGELLRIYTAIADIFAPSKEEIQEWARKYPNNEMMRCKWPWAFEFQSS